MQKLEDASSRPDTDIVSWVLKMVQRNRQQRDTTYKPRWDEYYKSWRGRWSTTSRSRASERSKLVSPATQSAIDIKLAEIMEALLGREAWFDVSASISDENKAAAIKARDQLMEDLKKDGIFTFLAEVILNGALYGQLNGKIVTEIKQEAIPVQLPAKDGKPPRVIRGYKERVAIYPAAMEPGQMVWDMSGPTRADDMLGLAHEFQMSLHKIKQRQQDGAYRKVSIGPMTNKNATFERMEEQTTLQDDSAFITEYHGLVPSRMIARYNVQDDDMGLQIAGQVPDHEMTEAIVTIANEGILLRAIANPSVMDDRAIVSEQFDTVPNSFLGRGDAEKAFNGQKGLDTELRARADALAWVNNPMMAGDMTRMMPKQDLNAWPGKFFGTNGDPSEVLKEFKFGDVNASTFQQAEAYERMIQQATGAIDPSTLRDGVRDETAMGSGIAASGMIKRSKRTMFHLEEFLNKLIRRILWRKMQFEPERYPMDFEFQVRGTIGILAREVELMHLTGMLQYVPEGSPVQMVIIKTLFEQSSSPYKSEMMEAVEQMQKPDPKAQQIQEMQQQLVMAEAEAKVNKLRSETVANLAKAGVSGADAMLKQVMAQIQQDDQRLERVRIMINQMEVGVQVKQTQQKDAELKIKAVGALTNLHKAKNATK